MTTLNDDLRGRSAREQREERDLLGFLRQPRVRWLSPGLLVRAGIEVGVSSAFGRFADKRELQRDPQEAFDYSNADELWLDYMSDTGDGWEATYTMAWLLAQPELVVDGQTLPRGKALMLGGDQVYPAAAPETYEDRFTGPFASALPWSAPGQEPELYATPGNHDWYDGLTSFLRMFCRGGWIGGWKTRQARSYFALRLPHRWWIWAIDIQLDTYLDNLQLEYFQGLDLQEGDKVVLLTAKPSWVKAHDKRVEPASWRYLAYFEEHGIRARGARLVLTLTGDLHHYARYEPTGGEEGGFPTRITSGGGGAYLSPTHTLRERVRLKPWLDKEPVTYERATIYPSEDESKSKRNGILALALLNPSFGLLLASIYTLFGITLFGAVNAGRGGLVEDGTRGGFFDFLTTAASAGSVLLAIGLLAALVGYADVKPDPLELRRGARAAAWAARALVGTAHACLHLGAICLTAWAALHWAPEPPIFVWLLGLAAEFAIGYAFGATLFALVLWLIHLVRGGRAEQHANEVFAGQALTEYKNFLRMRLDRDGRLTLFPLGVDRVCERWDFAGHLKDEPRFRPRGEGPTVKLIDGPLRFDT